MKNNDFNVEHKETSCPPVSSYEADFVIRSYGIGLVRHPECRYLIARGQDLVPVESI